MGVTNSLRYGEQLEAQEGVEFALADHEGKGWTMVTNEPLACGCVSSRSSHLHASQSATFQTKSRRAPMGFCDLVFFFPFSLSLSSPSAACGARRV